MWISLYPPMPTRPCRFCLSLQGGSVFADFDLDADGRARALRVSYDMFGCCHAPETIGRMSLEASRALLGMVDAGTIDAAIAEPILRAYFRDNQAVLWPSALARHGLV